MAWHSDEPPEYANDITLIERALGVRFLPRFAECVLRCNGGRPTPSGFRFVEPTHGDVTGHGVGKLLSFVPTARAPDRHADATPPDSASIAIPEIVRFHHDPPVDVPPGLVAFGECGNGDIVCFDYRANSNSSDPPVVLWQPEFLDDNPIAFVAGNFEAFLAMLWDGDPPPESAAG